MKRFRIELAKHNSGNEYVDVYLPDGDFWSIPVSHADFKRTCCDAFGLVDPDANADEFCRRLMAEKTRRDADHASEVLAAASRRLA